MDNVSFEKSICTERSLSDVALPRLVHACKTLVKIDTLAGTHIGMLNKSGTAFSSAHPFLMASQASIAFFAALFSCILMSRTLGLVSQLRTLQLKLVSRVVITVQIVSKQ